MAHELRVGSVFTDTIVEARIALAVIDIDGAIDTFPAEGAIALVG